MPDQVPGSNPETPKQEGQPKEPVRNPYIMNFLKLLIQKTGPVPPAEMLKKLLDDMYRLFENLLGQNMIKALPEDKQREYKAMSDDLYSLSYDKIGEIFDKHVPDYEGVMKRSMKEFAEIFSKNRSTNPEDYSIPVEPFEGYRGAGSALGESED